MKKLILWAAVIFTVLAMTAGCTGKTEIAYDQPQGEISDMSGYEGTANNPSHFVDMTVADAVAAIKDGKTMIIYFGEPECSWCLELVPVLDTYCEKYGYNVGYVNFLLEVNNQDEDSMDELMDLCGDKINTDVDGEKVFYFPTIMYIQKGVVMGLHIGTVNGHNAREEKMTESQLKYLNYLLDESFKALTEPAKS